VLTEKHFFRLLVLVALTDWLISRGLARVAIFIPKSPVLINGYQGLTFIGQYASVLSALLSLLGIGLITWRLRRSQGGIPSAALACLGVLSLALLLPAPSGWLQLLSLILVLGITIWLGWVSGDSNSSFAQNAAVLLPVAAVGVGSLYHAIQASYSIFWLPGPPAYAHDLFNLGELLVVLTPFCLWWAHGRKHVKRAAWAYTWGFIAAGLFIVFRLINPAMAGILAIWSTGLTLYLPAPLYAAAIGFWISTIIMSRSSGDPTGWALLLLACAGYAPQLSSQIFLGLIALSLMSNRRGEIRADDPLSPSFGKSAELFPEQPNTIALI